MRNAVQTASFRIQQHIQQGCAEDAALLSATSYPISLGSGVPASSGFQTQISGQDATFSELHLAVQHLGNTGLRGIVNAMACLHGLCELQRVGIANQGKESDLQKIAAVAKTYGISVHLTASEGHGPNEDPGVRSRGKSLDLNRLAIDHPQQDAWDMRTAWHEAVPFPGSDHMEAIHGSGTIALGLQNVLAIPAEESFARPSFLESLPDFILTDMDDGLSLNGVCMALAGTGTRVIAAAPMSGFWEHASKRHMAEESLNQISEHKYWEGNVAPMAAIPWETFRAPGNLHGVLAVDDQQMYAASIAARNHYNLQLHPDEVVPLAVAF